MLESGIYFNSVNLNRWPRNVQASPHWYSKVTNVDNLFGQDIITESHHVPGRNYDRSGASNYSGKTIVVSGLIRANKFDNLRGGQFEIWAAFWDRAEHQFRFQAWGSIQVYVSARVSQPWNSPEEQTNDKFERTWTVGLRADDPKWYRVDNNALYLGFQAD